MEHFLYGIRAGKTYPKVETDDVVVAVFSRVFGYLRCRRIHRTSKEQMTSRTCKVSLVTSPLKHLWQQCNNSFKTFTLLAFKETETDVGTTALVVTSSESAPATHKTPGPMLLKQHAGSQRASQYFPLLQQPDSESMPVAQIQRRLTSRV